MLYGLPRTTSDYAVRLEFGLSVLIVDILDWAVFWIGLACFLDWIGLFLGLDWLFRKFYNKNT